MCRSHYALLCTPTRIQTYFFPQHHHHHPKAERVWLHCCLGLFKFIQLNYPDHFKIYSFPRVSSVALKLRFYFVQHFNPPRQPFGLDNQRWIGNVLVQHEENAARQRKLQLIGTKPTMATTRCWHGPEWRVAVLPSPQRVPNCNHTSCAPSFWLDGHVFPLIRGCSRGCSFSRTFLKRAYLAWRIRGARR